MVGRKNLTKAQISITGVEYNIMSLSQVKMFDISSSFVVQRVPEF